MKEALARRRRLPAGNWPPYVQACWRKGLRFRRLALVCSELATAFFLAALWRAWQGRELLGLDAVRAGIACVCQLGVCIALALDLAAARKEIQSQL